MNLPIAEVIRRLRTEKEITQETLAAALGVTSQSVSRWENGNAYPDMELIPKIAMYFGVTTDILFGMNDEARQQRLARLKQICGELVCDDCGRITERQYQHHRAAHEEFPEETEFAFGICYDIVNGGIRPAEEHLDELRVLCRQVAETSVDDFEKWNAIRYMVMLEDEENLEPWLDRFPFGGWTKESVLLDRYRHRKDTQNSTRQIQKIILKELKDALHKFRGQYRTTNLRMAITGGHLALTIIDLLRDPSTDDDAWILERADIKRLLCMDYLAAGEDEMGYTMLEEYVDLLIHYHHFPRETVLSYNCPWFSELNHEKAKEEWLKECTAQTLASNYRGLTRADYPFSKYNGDPRMQKQINRLLEYITEVDLVHCV